MSMFDWLLEQRGLQIIGMSNHDNGWVITYNKPEVNGWPYDNIQILKNQFGWVIRARIGGIGEYTDKLYFQFSINKLWKAKAAVLLADIIFQFLRDKYETNPY